MVKRDESGLGPRPLLGYLVVCFLRGENRNQQNAYPQAEEHVGNIENGPGIGGAEMEVDLDEIDDFAIVKDPVIQIPQITGHQHTDGTVTKPLIRAGGIKKPEQKKQSEYRCGD